MERTRVTFASEGTTCVGDLTRPPGAEAPPVVVMAHGFGAQRDFGLEPVLERFVDRGFAVYRFDYRGFGDSAGPRQFVDPAAQRTDWVAAVDAVGDLEGVDTDRIVLWGTSLGGGHVVEAAARRDVAAVVSQVPLADGPATVRALLREGGLAWGARAAGHGLYDGLRGLVGREPHRVPIVGDPGEFALLAVPGAREGLLELVPEVTLWEDAVPARVGLQLLRYRPIRRAPAVDCPVFVGIATGDRLCPPRAAAALAAELPDATVYRVEGDHFDVYGGPAFEELLGEELSFLVGTLA